MARHRYLLKEVEDVVHNPHADSGRIDFTDGDCYFLSDCGHSERNMIRNQTLLCRARVTGEGNGDYVIVGFRPVTTLSKSGRPTAYGRLQWGDWRPPGKNQKITDTR